MCMISGAMRSISSRYLEGGDRGSQRPVSARTASTADEVQYPHYGCGDFVHTSRRRSLLTPSDQYRGVKTVIISLVAALAVVGGSAVGYVLYLQETFSGKIQHFGD